jgi:chemotaxis protein CheD
MTPEERNAETVRPPTRMQNHAKTRYLHPGDIFVSAGGETITTILGSCVSAFLHCHRTGVGGVNHFLLPFVSGTERSAKCGPIAMKSLIERVLAAGADPRALRAKVFGGACVLAPLRREGHLGVRNVEVARAMLSEARVPIVAEDVEGDYGRKVLFQLNDGSSWVKRL